jgi:ABC-type antimicrobial peptide transport system permease subunit
MAFVLLRIMKKGARLSLRTPKRFIAFIFIYSILIVGFAFNTEEFLRNNSVMQLGFTWAATAIVALFYAFLLTVFRKREIGTLKCVGWGNSHLMALIMGEMLFVSLVSFLIVVQLDIEILGGGILYWGPNGYQNVQNLQLVKDIVFRGETLTQAFGLILLAQIPGLLLANYRILKVRPITAVKETGG